MPRNSSGNYTLPAGNPVVPNTLIETTWANPTMSDIASSITDSLDRYGRGGMLAQLKLADGTPVQPAFAFNAESSTGLFRQAAGVLAFSILGVTAATLAAGAPAAATDIITKADLDSSVSGYLPLTGGTLAGPGNLTVSGDFRSLLTASLGTASPPAYSSILRVQGGIETYGQQFNVAPLVVAPFEFVNRINGGFDFYVQSGSIYAAGMTNTGSFLVGTPLNPNNRQVMVGGRVSAELVLKSTVASGGAGQSTLYFGNSGSDGVGFINYSHANNNLAFATNGNTASMFLDSLGRLGLGIVPSYNLHISGAASQTARISSTAGSAILTLAAEGSSLGNITYDRATSQLQFQNASGPVSFFNTSGNFVPGANIQLNHGVSLDYITPGSGSAQINNYRASEIEIIQRAGGFGISSYYGAGVLGHRLTPAGDFEIAATGFSSDYSGANTHFGIKGNAAGKIGTIIAQSAIDRKIEMFAGSTATECGLLIRSASNNMAFFTGDPTLERLRISPTGVITEMPSGFELGYKDIPRVTGGFERGKCWATAAPFTVNQAAPGNNYWVYNDSNASIAVTQGAGVTLRLGGSNTTGNRGLNPHTFCQIWYNAAGDAIMAGVGIT